VSNQSVGKQGETMAERYLKEKGYSILAKNFLKRSGEIDLIAKDPQNQELVFVEVKTRRSNTFGYPEEAVTQKKLDKIEQTALQWLEEKDFSDHHWRIDVIAVELQKNKKITHLKNISLQ